MARVVYIHITFPNKIKIFKNLSPIKLEFFTKTKIKYEFLYYLW